jgi:hypothetical protein
MNAPTPKAAEAWGLLWYSRCALDGERSYIIRQRTASLPALFTTRREARDYANEHYGYIKQRIDLRQEPHGWRFPRPIRLRITAGAAT